MPRMFAVDRRIYIGDEGRPMYNAGVFGTDLYVPADDLGAIGRRRWLSQAAALLLFLVGDGRDRSAGLERLVGRDGPCGVAARRSVCRSVGTRALSSHYQSRRL